MQGGSVLCSFIYGLRSVKFRIPGRSSSLFQLSLGPSFFFTSFPFSHKIKGTEPNHRKLV